MSSCVTVESVSCHADLRGWVVEPIAGGAIASQRNVHVVFTESGCIRGNHCHECTTEILLVVGPALVRWREGDKVCDQVVDDGQALRFTIPPGVAHAIQNTGTRPIVMASFNDRPHDRAMPDTVRDVLIES